MNNNDNGYNLGYFLHFLLHLAYIVKHTLYIKFYIFIFIFLFYNFIMCFKISVNLMLNAVLSFMQILLTQFFLNCNSEVSDPISPSLLSKLLTHTNVIHILSNWKPSFPSIGSNIPRGTSDKNQTHSKARKYLLK